MIVTVAVAVTVVVFLTMAVLVYCCSSCGFVFGLWGDVSGLWQVTVNVAVAVAVVALQPCGHGYGCDLGGEKKSFEITAS